ncbi:MAG TPA: FecR domain-containing protein [Pyrinomonadaceae bacterium]|nr:FecR domain-containing protein [Pyrinomonadaceae bacterium]
MYKKTIISVSLSILLAVVFVVATDAQTNANQYVVSAKAGGINFVSGDVTTKQRRATEAPPATTLDTLENGDLLQTGPDGRAEILLNPGSYLRLGENSAIEFTDTSLDSLRLKLSSGIALIEVAGDDDEVAPVELMFAGSSVRFDKKGVYRVQYREPEAVTVRIQKGSVKIDGEKIGDGKEIVFDRGKQVAVTKFDKKELDTFSQWSLDRAKTVAEANSRLSKDTVSRLSSGYRNSSFNRRRGFSGYWLYDPFYRSRTFLPFYSGWSSPYGHRYHRGFGFSHYGFGSFRRPTVVIHRPHRPVVIRHPVKHGGRRH